MQGPLDVIKETVKKVFSKVTEQLHKKRNGFVYDSTVLLGPQESGKTHLANWLNEKQLLKNYIPTNNKIKLGQFLDIRGGEIQVKDWENLVIEQKNIFYLFDMEKFLNKKMYSNTTYDDIVIKHISLLTEHLNIQDKKLIIIGTHFDKIHNNEAQNVINKLYEEINLGNAKIIHGSLLNEKKAKELEEEIIKKLKEEI